MEMQQQKCFVPERDLRSSYQNASYQNAQVVDCCSAVTVDVHYHKDENKN